MTGIVYTKDWPEGFYIILSPGNGNHVPIMRYSANDGWIKVFSPFAKNFPQNINGQHINGIACFAVDRSIDYVVVWNKQ